MSSSQHGEQLACGQLSCGARSLTRWINGTLAWGLGLLQPMLMKDQAHLHHEKVLPGSLPEDSLRGSSQTVSSPPALPAGKVVLGLHLLVSRLLAHRRVGKVVQESTTLFRSYLLASHKEVSDSEKAQRTVSQPCLHSHCSHSQTYPAGFISAGTQLRILELCSGFANQNTWRKTTHRHFLLPLLAGLLAFTLTVCRGKGCFHWAVE